MRLYHAILSDIQFQIKHGFYLVYILITAMYLIILSFLPDDILSIALPLVVYADPSILGLFFIGGIILLEKDQGVLLVLVVSPLRSLEYVLSKTISLSIISVLAAFAISFFSQFQNVNWLILFVATVLTSAFFTLCGIMINAACKNVNQYLLKTIPYMFLLIIPCFSLLGFPYSQIFCVIPSVAALKLTIGAFHGINSLEAVCIIIYLIVINSLMLKFAIRTFEHKIVYQD